MSIRTQEGRYEGPTSGQSKYPPSVQVLGYVAGTTGFVLLALSGDERPVWLRAAYAVVALTFAVGAVVTAVRRRKRP
ncbi:hypothetical protein ACIQXA_32855 [Streptomyces massasporeus]|uniref:hypothetical protein n=1 Tax=Streptomyces massasporeus TaxID=67324 RepID=UPI0038165F91